MKTNEENQQQYEHILEKAKCANEELEEVQKDALDTRIMSIDY